MTGLDVLYCDNHLLVVCKPAGMPTVPDASADECLLDRARKWVAREFAKPGNVFLGVVHRLDRPVSGLVVLARTSKSAARLSAQWRERSIEKVYLGVGAGDPPSQAGETEEHLLKDERNNVVSSVEAGRSGALSARTRWRVLERRHGRTLYEFQPLTGRPHQLRSCARSLGTPLFGDVKYGAGELLPDRSIALHAVRLALAHPTREERLVFACPPPRESTWEFEHLRSWSALPVSRTSSR